jgi:hypothetical protein
MHNKHLTFDEIARNLPESAVIEAEVVAALRAAEQAFRERSGSKMIQQCRSPGEVPYSLTVCQAR